MENSSSLPMNTIKEIPTPNADAATITALLKSGSKVTGYRLSNGQTLSKAEAIALARRGGIAGVGISSRKGNEYLKSLPDKQDANNLSHLPSVSQP